MQCDRYYLIRGEVNVRGIADEMPQQKMIDQSRMQSQKKEATVCVYGLKHTYAHTNLTKVAMSVDMMQPPRGPGSSFTMPGSLAGMPAVATSITFSTFPGFCSA